MTIFRYFPAVIFALFAGPTLAADANGYTAKYECRAGGPNCNVDVATLSAQSCDQIVETDTAWASIVWSNNVICLRAGDHSSKGTLNLGASGTSGTRKVLRCVDAVGAECPDPWRTTGNRANISKLRTANRDYWTIDRIASNNSSSDYKIEIVSGSTSNDIIFNRMYITGSGGGGDGANVYFGGGSNLWFQNSVSADCQVEVNKSHQAILFSTTNTYIVNNELYDCAKGIGNNYNYALDNSVIENNDVYITPNKRTDCAGNYTTSGECSIAKALITVSTGSATTAPVHVIHNRAWGIRACDTDVSCSGGGSEGYAIGGGAGGHSDYVLFKDNIITESGGGFLRVALSAYNAGSTKNSFIGNIVYDIRVFNRTTNSGILWYAEGSNVHQYTGLHLNTFIAVRGDGWLNYGSVQNSDLRCNVVIDSDPKTSTGGTGTLTDYNVYYGTKDAGEINKKTNSLSIRTGSTNYTTGAIVISSTIAGCTTAGDAACFLYRATAGGTTGSSLPTWCTTLGCTVTDDGGVTWQAIRGAYTFKRRLLTVAGGETVTIPYARPHVSAPEFSGCPTSTVKPGVGINDTPLL